jgi:hypothetical protein
MANKSSKIIILFFSTIFLVLLIPYIQTITKPEWRTVNGFELKIQGNIEEIEEFYSDLENRLIGYPDWVNIVLTGELSNFQKDYSPFRIPDSKFENYNKIYTSTEMTQLLTKYSLYLETVLLKPQALDSSIIAIELNRLHRFSSILNSHIVQNQNVFVGDIIDIIKFDINQFYDSINNTQTIYIFLNEGEFVNSQSKQIANQLQIEIKELTKLIDIDISVLNHEFQILNIDTLDLLANEQKYRSSGYSHIYKYLPSINYNAFNTRMSLMKKNIQNNNFNAISTPSEFLMILSIIEEQLIEFQLRGNFHCIYILNSVNKLVGDGVTEAGLLTSMINLLNDRKYTYIVKDYLSESSEYLNIESRKIAELTYPRIESLPNIISSKYLDNNHSMILKIK